MKKILLYIYDGMADYEVTFLIHMLSNDLNKEVITISDDNNLLKSKSGISYKPTVSIDEISIDEIEGIIIPGGWNNSLDCKLIQLVKNINSQNKLIAAICFGTRILAESGVLNNVKYTTSIKEWTSELKKIFKEEDPFPRHNFIDERIVRDKNIITAKGIAFIDFAIEVSDVFGYFEDEEDKTLFKKAITG